jgi:hypothetical protein
VRVRVRPPGAATGRLWKITEELRRGAGLLLAAALVFAPWCWGCAWPEGIGQLDLILLAAVICWLPGAALRRGRPPRVLAAAVALILFQGWLMTLNSRAIFAATTGFFAPLEQPLSWLAGSVERDLSREMMARVTALLGAALVAASLGRERVWRERFAAVIIATAVSLVLLGCAQRWSGATDIFWGARRLDYFFASYRNVTNGGEYLNLALPLAGAAAWMAIGRKPVVRAAAVCALAVIVVGSFICGSKAAPLLTVVLGFGFLLGQRRAWAGSCAGWRSRVIVVLVVSVAVTMMAWGGGLGVSQDRWHRLFEPSGAVTLSHRLAVDRACLAAVPFAGWFGAGPGTFPVIFPAWQDALPDPPPGQWLAAHDDYLQTALEWGAAGTLAWSAYFFGAVAALALGLRQREWHSDDRVWALGLLLALAGTAGMALIDFPLQVASLQLDVAVLAGLGWSSLAWSRARGHGA